MFSFLSHDESARVFGPFSRVFPPFSRNVRPEKSNIFFTQSKVISAQKVRNLKIDHSSQEMTISSSFTRNPP